MGTTKETVVIDVQLKGDAVGKTDQLNANLKKAKTGGKETTDTFGLMNTGIGKMATGIISFGKKGVMAFKTLRGAVISTGIGALVVVVASLVQYFTKTERGANKLKVVMSFLGGVMGKVSDVFVKAGEGIVKLFSSTENLKIGLKSLGKTLLENVINRFKAFGIIGKAIVKILHGKFKEGFKELGKGAVQAATGVTNLSDKLKKGADKLKKFAEATKKAGEDAAKLQERENKLAIDKRNNLVEEAKLQTKLAKLKADLNNTNLTEEERLKKTLEAEKIQNEISDKRIALKKEEYEIQKERNKLSSSTAEDKEKEKQLEADLILLEAERAQKQKLLITKQAELTKQIAAKKQKEKDEKTKEDQEALERTQSFNDRLKEINDEAYEETLKTDEERREYELQKEEEEFQEDLQKQLNNKEITQEQAESLEEAFHKKMSAIRAKNAKEDAAEQKKIDDAKIIAKQNVQDAETAVALQGLDALTKIFKGNKELATASLLINKGIAIGRMIQDTSIANAKAVATSPLTFGQPWVGINTASTVVSIASTLAETAKAVSQINSTQTPTSKKALGGWILGQSHQNGGVNINGEDGEFMVNKRTMSNPLLASAVINANNIGNGNNVNSAGILTEERVAEIASIVVASVPVNVVESDITSTQRKVQVRENRYIN